jgi:hypothetical protein
MNVDYLVHSTCKRKKTIKLKRDTKKNDTKNKRYEGHFFTNKQVFCLSVEKWKSTLYFIVNRTSVE